MIVENPRSLTIRKCLAHGFLLFFIALILFPFLMVLSISFREGNFSTGSIWPDRPTLEHWVLALGFDYTHADGSVSKPPYPVLLWLWNSVKIGLITSVGVLLLSTTSAYAFARMKFVGNGQYLTLYSLFRCSRLHWQWWRSMQYSRPWEGLCHGLELIHTQR